MIVHSVNVYNPRAVSVKSELTTMHPSRYTRRIMRILAFSYALLLPLAAFAQVPNVDLSGLTDGDKASFMKLAEKFPSACGKAHSLLQSLKSDPKCKRSVFAGRYIAKLL